MKLTKDRIIIICLLLGSFVTVLLPILLIDMYEACFCGREDTWFSDLIEGSYLHNPPMTKAEKQFYDKHWELHYARKALVRCIQERHLRFEDFSAPESKEFYFEGDPREGLKMITVTYRHPEYVYVYEAHYGPGSPDWLDGGTCDHTTNPKAGP